ncbi:MAG: hypothetical protein ACFFD4_13000 [Candidatus Odinarchaeota archaeon]
MKDITASNMKSFIKNRVIYLLYLIILLELLVSVFMRTRVMTLSIILLAIIALTVHGYRHLLTRREQFPTQSPRKEYDWMKAKNFLENVLVSSNILPVSSLADGKNGLLQFIDDFEQVNENLSTLKPESVRVLRSIGIYGLLISLFLLQQENAFCSVKVIQKGLNIPLSTVYRTMQRLEEQDQIISHYVLDSPNKAYYRLTPEGESLILELYELLGGDEFVFARNGFRRSQPVSTG